MVVKVLDSYEAFQEALASGKPFLVDFWATWCGPCKAISPIFAKLSESAPEVDFYKVDVDEQEKISQEVGIRAMPTFILFDKGQKVTEVVGARPAELETLISTGKGLVA